MAWRAVLGILLALALLGAGAGCSLLLDFGGDLGGADAAPPDAAPADAAPDALSRGASS
jgi:hypothetical protein